MTPQELLSGSPCITPKWEAVYHWLAGRKVLITGACGSVGSALFDLATSFGARVHGIDHDEAAVFLAQSKGKSIELGDFIDSHFIFLGQSFDLIFHCAAYKHVGVRPTRALRINNEGKVAQFLMQLFPQTMEARSQPPKFFFLSTDKAAGITTMGLSKLAGEEWTLKYGQCAIRLVNIAGSRNSVLDLWNRGKNGDLFLCNPDTKRLWMQLDDALYLLLLMAYRQKSGRFTVTCMPEFSMGELAEAWKQQAGYSRDFLPLPKRLEEAPSECLVHPKYEEEHATEFQFLSEIHSKDIYAQRFNTNVYRQQEPR